VARATPGPTIIHQLMAVDKSENIFKDYAVEACSSGIMPACPKPGTVHMGNTCQGMSCVWPYFIDSAAPHVS
jgi:hypothetical protein